MKTKSTPLPKYQKQIDRCNKAEEMNKKEHTGIDLDRHPSIHHTGSVSGMKKLGYWGKKDICVRIGSYIYNLSITLTPPKAILP